jgi:hypothetical protein
MLPLLYAGANGMTVDSDNKIRRIVTMTNAIKTNTFLGLLVSAQFSMAGVVPLGTPAELPLENLASITYV